MQHTSETILVHSIEKKDFKLKLKLGNITLQLKTLQ